MPPGPLRLHYRTQCLCPPPQNLYLIIIFAPAPLIHLKTFAALCTHHAWFVLTGIHRLTFCLFLPSSFFLSPTPSFPLFLSTSFLSPTSSLLPHLTSFHLSFPPLLSSHLSLSHPTSSSLTHSLLPPLLPPPLQNVPVSDEDIHTPLQQGGYEGGGGGGEEPEKPDYALPPDAGEVMIHLLNTSSCAQLRYMC